MICNRNVRNLSYGTQSKKQYAPKEACNEIENTWHQKKVYSSWLTYFDYGRNNNIIKRYALANTFFRFRLQSDCLLNGTGVASICSWNVDKSIQSEHNVNQLSFYETTRNVVKKKRDDTTTSPSIAYRIRSLPFCLWYHIVVSRSNY